MQESRDAPRPQWGPGFVSLDSWPYRIEYGVASVALLAIVFGWRMAILRDFPVSDVLLFVLFFLLPDIVAFVPIGVSRPPAGHWPRWGPTLYNGVHSLLVWAAVFLLAWLLTGAILWPLLGWAAHITVDRSVGYHLRARESGDSLPSGQ